MRCLLTILALLQPGAAQVEVKDLDAGLVLDLPLDNGYTRSATVASDRSGNGLDGTATGSPPVFGAPGEGVTLNGTSDFISIPDDPSLSHGNGTTDTAFSMTAWIKPVEAQTFRIASKIIDATAYEYLWTTSGLTSEELRLFLYDDTGANSVQWTATTDLGAFENTWIHIAVTYNGGGVGSGNAIHYLNGVAETESSTSVTGVYTAMDDSAATFSIGRFEPTPTYADGGIGLFKMHDRALTAAAIAALHAKGRGGNDALMMTLDEQLTFHAPLTGGYLQTGEVLATDVSGFGNHATTDNGSATYSATGYECDGVTDYLTVPATNIYGADKMSIMLRFTPDFATNADATYVFYDATSGSRFSVIKAPNAGSNILRIFMGNTNVAEIPEATYSPHWNVDQENSLIVTGDDSANLTNVYMNNVQILTDDPSAWSTASPANLYVCAAFNGTGFFDGELREMRVNSLIVSANQRGMFHAGNRRMTLSSLEAGKVAHWPLYDGYTRSSTIATDIVAGLDGVLTGTPPTFGARGEGVTFNGTTDYVAIADDDVFSFTDGAAQDLPFSIGFWINMDDATGFRLSKDDGVTREWSFGADPSDKLACTLFTDGANFIRRRSSSVITADEGSWHMYACVYDGSEVSSGLTLYRDGVVLASVSAPLGSHTGMSNTAQPVWLGRIAAEYGDGKLQSVPIHDRILTAPEVAELFAQGRSNP